IAAEGTTREAAIADFIDALRDYVEDWDDHLAGVPNHVGNRALVEAVRSSTDEQLALWAVNTCA
ncbi:MAG TPA: hypothetical protein VF867_13165, partial [Arthrobacter sp.]